MPFLTPSSSSLTFIVGMNLFEQRQSTTVASQTSFFEIKI
jgi:hypothetical protein